ncbi:beta-1,4 N-acetylgalactosaminyltransferase 2-like isoform X2 [Hyperolius riggenbachi]|uniref:beta-1,4 N-acetylgalactosaminyltransferase 2-like isoform X2 n=1 Tax=Hyperolius riggenbachi TaxID=752182 RepID=UPI0035A2CA96
MCFGKLLSVSSTRKSLLFVIIISLGCVLLGYRKWFDTRKSQDFCTKDTLSEPGEGLDLTQDSISVVVFQKNTCACQPMEKGQVYQLKEFVPADDLMLVTERRKKEYEHLKKRGKIHRVIVAPSNSPLRYPIHGVQVMPLHTILLPGLQIDASLPQYKVILEASLGSFAIQRNTSVIHGFQIHGTGEKQLSISTNHSDVLNQVLSAITYTSTVYSIDSLDIVTFSMGQYSAHIPISIRQPPIARLHDPGPDRNINSLVTITTKTFLRYDKLRQLLRSIRQYYPDIKVIVADDNEKTEKIEDSNVEQYIMPYAKVGGSVAGNHFMFKLLLEEGGEEGDCLHWRGGGYHDIKGFPDCILAGGVVNFFLAHPDKVLSVGFDPKLNRVAHTEFFIDGLGRLRIGSCSHVTVGHQPKNDPKDETLRQQLIKYDSFRHSSAEQERAKLGLLYFKNRLSCYTRI